MTYVVKFRRDGRDEVRPGLTNMEADLLVHYLFDVYRDGSQLLTAGYYGEALLLACGFGYTIPTAWEAALEVAAQVKFPGRAYRLDGAGTDFPSSPLRRYEALTAMGYL